MCVCGYFLRHVISYSYSLTDLQSLPQSTLVCLHLLASSRRDCDAARACECVCVVVSALLLLLPGLSLSIYTHTHTCRLTMVVMCGMWMMGFSGLAIEGTVGDGCSGSRSRVEKAPACVHTYLDVVVRGVSGKHVVCGDRAPARVWAFVGICWPSSNFWACCVSWFFNFFQKNRCCCADRCALPQITLLVRRRLLPHKHNNEKQEAPQHFSSFFC